MDLKALLVEAKQKVPPVLQVLQTGDETMLDIGGESLTCLFFCIRSLNPWVITSWVVFFIRWKDSSLSYTNRAV